MIFKIIKSLGDYARYTTLALYINLNLQVNNISAV